MNYEVIGTCLVCGAGVRKYTDHPEQWLNPKSVITDCPRENAISGVSFYGKRVVGYGNNPFVDLNGKEVSDDRQD